MGRIMAHYATYGNCGNNNNLTDSLTCSSPLAAAKTKKKLARWNCWRKDFGVNRPVFYYLQTFLLFFYSLLLTFRHLLSAAESPVAPSVSEPDTELCSLHEWRSRLLNGSVCHTCCSLLEADNPWQTCWLIALISLTDCKTNRLGEPEERQ